MDTPTADIETAYWNFFPAIGREERQRLAERNADLSGRLQRFVDGSPGISVGPIYVGVYPSKLVQATTTAVTSGTLILVYEKLLHAIAEMAAVVAAVFPGRLGGEEVPPDLSEADAHKALRSIVGSTLQGQSLMLAIQLDQRRVTLATMLAELATNFVIAHELAHVVLGHLAARNRRIRGKSGALLISLPSWQMEMAADTRGFRIAQASYERLGLEMQYLGAVLFFEIEEMADSLRVEAEPALAYDLDDVSTVVSHPRASTRRTNLITDTHPDSIRAELPVVDWLVGFIARGLGKPALAVDAGALEALRQIANTCDRDRYKAALRIGESQEGVTFYEMSALYRYVEESHEQARAAVAFSAMGCLEISAAQNEFFRVTLPMLYSVYRQTYQNRPNDHIEEAGAFEQLLRACVPDLDDMLIEMGRVVKGQHDAT